MIPKICSIKDTCLIYKRWKKELGKKNQNVIFVHNKTLDATANYPSKTCPALGKASFSKLEHRCIALDYVNKQIEKENRTKEEEKDKKGYENCVYINDLNIN